MQFNKPIDNRFGWDLIRRKPLEHICKLEGVKIREGATHMEMKIALDSHNVSPMKYQNLVLPEAIHGNQSGDIRVPNMETEVRKKEEEIKIKLVDVSFEKMSMPELRKECTLQGIKWNIRHKKAELLSMIKEKMNGNTSPGS